ncbi:Small ubiquitin-related modifier [Lachnellula suecica]|uniref:Small ubiquitin-related modifier n=1 Tax=Lachnellula suecica TaxID=602035 RepID=A0A8T9CCJ5_9HELO|nr:Small ubiquitin-related modifier [Lachnellula suecica]
MSDNGSPGPEEPKSLTITVRDPASQEMQFKIKNNTRMEKVTNAFCKAQGIGADTRRFTLDGHRIQKGETPKMLEMEDGDVIDVFVEQLGGVLS